MSHAFAQAVKLSNPGTPISDADNTTTVPGVPTVVDSTADLWELNVEQQVLDSNGTVLADWQGMFPPDASVTPQTKVREVATNALYRVHGQPQLLRSLRTGQPDHIEARLKYISDQQGAPS